MRPFDKILIANRGEIAVRIIRACREMNIRSVAVYSEADARALHVRLADEALFVGPAPAPESYLSIERVLAAALKARVQAVHPGYGFLSENPDFAQAVRANGLGFIGPSPDAIRAMGDKENARSRMRECGVPIVPGFQESNEDLALRRAADDLGYPVLVKAAAGGGGKAMRVVHVRGELSDALEAAHREAQNAFGDSRLFLEKYIEGGRHIEFQVFGDEQGNLVHLFERECSIQRRHQKIIEETPSPLLDSALRERMGNAAVAAAGAVGYVNAGTVEFIVDPTTRDFYFLEMNTRLQVEHPITEMVTGLDLVQWQIRVAQGERFPYHQSDLSQRGHAIECRVYAEDPENQFLPSTGCLLQVVEPKGPGVRVDSGVARGDQVTVYYDPMLAKVIVQAETRDAAIVRMRNALQDMVVHGVKTNLEFLNSVMHHPEFVAGKATTAFVQSHFANWSPEFGEALRPALLAAAIVEAQSTTRTPDQVTPGVDDPYSPWARSEGFRVGTR